MAVRTTTYGSSAAITISLASLASSTTLVAGRESTAISNTTTLALDELLAGKITTGTTPTAGIIEIWVYGSQNDTPIYPDVISGTDSAKTINSEDIKRAGFGHIATLVTDATSNRAYYFKPVSVASRFGGSLPKNWGVFITHSTVAVLNATAGNHIISHTPITETIA